MLYSHLRIQVILLMIATLFSGCSQEEPWEPDTSTDAPPDVAPDRVDVMDGVDSPDVTTECPDSDGDGVCDEDDRCPGEDDRVDSDGDGIPDMCDCDGTGIECDENATCYNRPGGPECVCNDGYEGDGFTCTPIDHCARGTHACDINATCTYTGPGTYDCECNPGYVGDGFTCTAISAGHMVVIGHDYYDTNAAADDIIGNAVFLTPATDVYLLAYTQYAHMGEEKLHVDAAIEQRRAELGRTLTRIEMTNHTLLGTGSYDLASYDVFLIYEQESSSTSTMETIGAAWASQLSTFLADGGVIVVSDGHLIGSGSAAGGGSHILHSAGLLDVTATTVTYFATETVTVVAPMDPVASGVPSTYYMTNSTTWYGRPTSWNIVVQDSGGRPCVLHWSG